jgi:hypothetical protein
MVEEDAYCIDIVTQINAIQAALQKVSSTILDRHLHTCVTTAIRGDDPAERERVISELWMCLGLRGRSKPTWHDQIVCHWSFVLCHWSLAK